MSRIIRISDQLHAHLVKKGHFGESYSDTIARLTGFCKQGKHSLKPAGRQKKNESNKRKTDAKHPNS